MAEFAPQRVLVVEDETDFDSIVDRLDSFISLRDGEHKTWLAWCSTDGDWYGIRPLDEDDGTTAQATDPARPIGPFVIEDLPRPWVIASPAVPYLIHPTEKKD